MSFHEYWLFPFERFNGSLGRLPHNNKSIEIQLMKRFAYDQHVLSLPKEFSELVSDMPKAVGSIGDTLHPSNKWELLPGIEGCWSIDAIKSSIDLPTFHTTALFESSEVQSLTELYSALYSVRCGCNTIFS